MKITLFSVYEHALNEDLEAKTAIVIDLLRATSVITTALENGAKTIIPVMDADQAIKFAGNNVLLGGERGGLKIEGFDLGNSPFEYTEQHICGKTLVLTTTNGTRAIKKAETHCEKVFIGCVRNADAVADIVAGDDKLVLICAGTNGYFSLDDIYAAGCIIFKLLSKVENVELDDQSNMALWFYRASKINKSLVYSALHVRVLDGLGFSRDVEFCLEEDVATAVGRVKDGKIVL